MKSREKRDIVEVIGEFIELEGPFGETDTPYYRCTCPFHNDHNPSFAVYEKSQKCVCYSCWPEGGDVIDFLRKYKDWDFITALEYATNEVAEEDAVARTLKKDISDRKIDMSLFALRAYKLYHKLLFDEANQIMNRVDHELENGKWQTANLILRQNGV